jgi:tetratricopeptide (TPR) repeat protein
MENEIKDIIQLKKEIEDLNPQINLAYVSYFESNLPSIEVIDVSKNEEHYNAKLRLTSDYGLSLNAAGQYKNAIPVLEEAIYMFENSPYHDPIELKNIDFYEHLLFRYGAALRDIQEVERSGQIFKRLVEYYPQNDK